MFYQHNFYIPSESQMTNLSPTPKIPSGQAHFEFAPIVCKLQQKIFIKKILNAKFGLVY